MTTKPRAGILAIVPVCAIIACVPGGAKQHAPPTPCQPASRAVNDTTESYIRRTLLQMGTLRSGIATYYRANGSLPHSLERAFQAVSPSEHSIVFVDARQRPIRYDREDDTYVLRAEGVDSVFGTEDDIVWMGFRDRIDPCTIVRGDGRLQHFEQGAPACPRLVEDWRTAFPR
jgi:hypothetical protein